MHFNGFSHNFCFDLIYLLCITLCSFTLGQGSDAFKVSIKLTEEYPMWITLDTRYVDQNLLNILGPILSKISNKVCSNKEKNVFSYSVYTNQFTKLIRPVENESVFTQTQTGDVLFDELKELGISIVDPVVDKVDAANQTDVSNTPSTGRVLPNWMRAGNGSNNDETNLKRKREVIDIERIAFKPVPFIFNDKAILNLTNIEIPSDVSLLLSFGPHFIPPVIEFDKIKIFSDISNSVVPRGTYGEILKLIQEYKSAEPSWRQTQIDNLVKLTSAFLKTHPELVITTTNEDAITVIMTRDFYNHKVSSGLFDDTFFTSVVTSQHELLIKRNYTLLLRCAEEGFISHNSVLDILARETRFSYVFGQTVIHELDSLQLHFKKFVGNMLSHIISPILDKMNSGFSLNIQNSRVLCHRLKRVNVLKGDMLFKLKIVDLFKMTTADLVLDHIKSLDLKEFTKMSADLFKSIFKFLTSEVVEFMFDNKFYDLRRGIPRDDIISSAVAGLSISNILMNALSIIKPMTFLCQHMDEIFFITSKDNAFLFVDILNLNHLFEFDMMPEVDDMLNFLELTVIRKSDCLLFKWYCDPKASNRLINWFSGHDKKAISSKAIGFVRYILSLTSPIFREDIEFLAYGVLESNSFPIPVIKNIISNIDKLEYIVKEPTYVSTCAPLNLMTTFNTKIRKGVQGQDLRFINGSTCLGDSFYHLHKCDDSLYRNFVVLKLSCNTCDFSCVSPVIYPIVLFTAVNLDHTLHPFYDIQRHVSFLKHASDFDVKVIRICKSKEETLRLAEIEAIAMNLNVHKLAKKSVPEIIRKSSIRK